MDRLNPRMMAIARLAGGGPRRVSSAAAHAVRYRVYAVGGVAYALRQIYDGTDWSDVGDPIAAEYDYGAVLDGTDLVCEAGAALAPSASPCLGWDLDGGGDVPIDLTSGAHVFYAEIIGQPAVTYAGLFCSLADGQPGAAAWGHHSGIRGNGGTWVALGATGVAAWGASTTLALSNAGLVGLTTDSGDYLGNAVRWSSRAAAADYTATTAAVASARSTGARVCFGTTRHGGTSAGDDSIALEGYFGAIPLVGA